MLGEKQWFAEPDDSVGSWLLLVLETPSQEEETYISGWQVGLANTQNILQFESMEIGSPMRETELLSALLDELRPHRRSDLTIITPTEHTLHLLRSRLLVSPITSATLRGFDHLSTAKLVEQYFMIQIDADDHFLSSDLPNSDQPLQSTCSLGDLDVAEHQAAVEQLWGIFIQLGPLVPRRLLIGSPL
ncbi:hypothetical protein [Natrarchaeobaculum sulfurireducens]|uniref:Uncharacterized protein n=1 Tax=Natrarchaeobaculum sulfurireducens TaxID=2044521 RepID=A0A346PD92_9EURY|nr:hypothetical protein [Natrarchaeobaculum sulfurireducens]AXR77487.1 hypothetical protein AArc1_1146 [Natrarchaeobaculum sulfurireducens]